MRNDYEDAEKELNDGTWSTFQGGASGEVSGEEPGPSIARFASLSAAVLVSTMMMQRRVARRMGAWDLEGEGSSSGSPGGVLRPHPVISVECLDESDTESIRKMPTSHFIDDVKSSYAGSVCDSVRTHSSRGPSLSFIPSPNRQRMKTVGTDPMEVICEKEVERVDRGCSPVPVEWTFDSDLDCGEGFRCACELWHLRPTVNPGMETEILKEQQSYIRRAQKQWKNRLQMTGHKEWKKNPFRMEDVPCLLRTSLQ